jgi:hypothetical protein
MSTASKFSRANAMMATPTRRATHTHETNAAAAASLLAVIGVYIKLIGMADFELCFKGCVPPLWPAATFRRRGRVGETVSRRTTGSW